MRATRPLWRAFDARCVELEGEDGREAGVVTRQAGLFDEGLLKETSGQAQGVNQEIQVTCILHTRTQRTQRGSGARHSPTRAHTRPQSMRHGSDHKTQSRKHQRKPSNEVMTHFYFRLITHKARFCSRRVHRHSLISEYLSLKRGLSVRSFFIFYFSVTRVQPAAKNENKIKNTLNTRGCSFGYL